MAWDAHKEHTERLQEFHERIIYVLGDTGGVKMTVGKHEAMNWEHMKGVYTEAREKCPKAADTIAWMLWHDILDYERLVRLTSEAAKTDGH